MVECHKDGGRERRIIPVFFDVDPKDVRHHSGPFQDAFRKHQKDSSSEVGGWKKALKYVGGIYGFHLKNGNQRELMSSITAEIEKVLPIKQLRYEGECHVGLQIRVEKMVKRLDFQAKDVRLIGIHGIGGIGKTTLATAIYNRSHRFFEACSFVENVREIISKSPQGLIQLQRQLIRDISNSQRHNVINNPSEGTQMIINMVGMKSVLLVLDDVDDRKVLEALAAGEISWFKSGSRIIITTRQKEILELSGLRGDAVYMLEELDKEESLQLFKYHAFGDQEPQEEYIKLSKEVVSISNGLPLILEAYGPLFKKANTLEEWQSLMREVRLRRTGKVHERLKICYERLNNNEKLIFLDVACLLVGKNSEVAIWEDILSPHQAIISLQSRSLIKIIKGKFEMHDQIRDMGREIVLTESLLHPERRSRLWCEEDVVKALTMLQGNMIQGILFNSREENEAKFGTEAFQLMSEIRILLINSANFSDSDFRHLPACLKWLEWKGCPLQTLPLECKFKSLVVLNLSQSFIGQLWSDTETGSSSTSTKELFGGLKVLDLSSCDCLIATSNFAMAPNLEKLILDKCSKLKEVDDSIGSLKMLVFLSMRECVSLEKLPDEIYGLCSLAVFNLEGCKNLVAFPQFPPTNCTTGFLKLKQLILRDCQSLKVLPVLQKFQSLRSLHIDGCQLLDHRKKHMFQDVAFREWDELSVSGSRTESLNQEFCFLLPVGSSNDPLLLLQLHCQFKCQGYGDPCENGTIKLRVRHQDMANNVILETTYEAYDAHDHCYTINFGRNDRINQLPRDKTIIMKVRPSNNFELTKVDVKVQKRSQFSYEKIEVLDLSCCKFLVKLTDLAWTPNLKELILDHCECLLEIGESIGELKNLILLSMVGCANLCALPCGILQLNSLQLLSLEGCSKIRILPEADIMDVRLKSLQRLILDHCTSLKEIPNYVGGLKYLLCLSLKSCSSLKQIPRSIGSLEVLEDLILDDCTSLMEIPNDFGGLFKCLRRLSLEGCSSLQRPPSSIGSFVVLEELILDHCTSLMEIPNDFGRKLKCLRRLSLEGCSSLQRLPSSIGSLVILEELILDHCTSLRKMPDDFERLFKCLRRLSLKGCFCLLSIGRLETTQLDWKGNLKSLINPSAPYLSNSTALEELNVGDCRSLLTIHGLQKLRSLKVLHLNNCWVLDTKKIWFQLKEAAFDDLQAFSIVSRFYGEGVKTASLPFPNPGCMRNKPLQLEKMDLYVTVDNSKELQLGAKELIVGVSVGSDLFPVAQPQMAIQMARQVKDPDFCSCSFTARFGTDDEINNRLRVEATSATPVLTLHISCQHPTFSMELADIWFRT